MRYVDARLHEETDAETYRIYISECVKAIACNTARFNGGIEVRKSYTQIKEDLRHPETRTAEEIIEHMKQKLNAFAQE